MTLGEYTYALLPESPIDEFTPTQDVSGPATPKPLTRVPRQCPPPTPRMGRLEKEAAKNARNAPKTVSRLPPPLPQVVEADQAPTAGIPPVPDPLEPTILPQVVETAGVPTPETTISPKEAFPLAPVPLTGAQETVANTARNRVLRDAALFAYRQSSIRVNPERLISEALNSAVRTSTLTNTTLCQHVRLRKRNLTAVSAATRKLSTFKATTLKDARILAIHVSVARRVSQTAPSVLRTSVVQELNSHLLCVAEDLLALFSLRKLFQHLSRMAPLSPQLDKPGLSAVTDPIRVYRAAARHVKAAALNLDHLLETQKRLTATKDGRFMVPGSPPPGFNCALRSTILGGGDDRWLPPPSYPPRKFS